MWASTLPATSSAAPWPTTTTMSAGVLIGAQQEVGVSTTSGKTPIADPQL